MTVFAASNAKYIQQAVVRSLDTDARCSRIKVCLLAINISLTLAYITLLNSQNPITSCFDSH
jgi:hypothetical protein